MEPPPPYPTHSLDPNVYFSSPQPLSRYLPLEAPIESHPQAAPFPVYQQLQPITHNQQSTQVHPLEALYQQQPQQQHPPVLEPFPTHTTPFEYSLSTLELPTQPLSFPQTQVPSQQVVQPPPTSPNTSPSPPSSPTTPTTTTPSAHNNKQSQSTFKWLEGNFQFRSHVSISRSTIYELYQKFCTQNAFVAVCKATFGKIIRIKFPKVKSKRLGARGQSKYHYYNITFKDERKRCSMLLSPVSEVSDQNMASNPNSGPVTSGFGPYIPLPASSSSQFTNQWDSQSQQPQQQPILTQLGPWNGDSQTSIVQQNNSGYFVSAPEPSSAQLTIFSNRASSLETYSHFNLNESDYHAIIQSMLSYMRIPANEQPLTNTKFVFINLYKIHCQCLIDSALSGNYAQMRHYLMHFWQQLPRHVTIYLSSMARLDSHMYSLLEDIYLAKLDTSLDNCRRLHTVATLIPVWLRKTFEYIPFEGEWWDLVAAQTPEDLALLQMNVGEIKVAEAQRWKWRIKFKVDFIVMLKKLTLSSLRVTLSSLLHAFDLIFEVTPTAYYDLDASPGYQTLVHQELYTNSNRPNHSLFTQTQSTLWNTLLRQFRLLLVRLLEACSSDESSSSSEAPKSESSPLAGQRIIDELDQMIASIEATMSQRNYLQSFGGHSGDNFPSAQQCQFYGDLTLFFVRLFDDLFSWFAVEQILTLQESELVDVWVDEDEEEDDENDILCNSLIGSQQQFPSLVAPIKADESNQALELTNPQTVSQVYLLLTTIQAYLMEVCQTAQRKRRYGSSSPGEEIEQIDF